MFKDILEVLTATMIICGVVLSVIVGIANIGSRIGCENQAEIMGVNHKYGLFEGCLLEVKGRYIPKGNLNLVDLVGEES